MSEYTSGPWFVRNWGDETDEWPQKRVSISNGKEALFINARFANNVEADARLIAAAPELLEELERRNKLLGQIVMAARQEQWDEVARICSDLIVTFPDGEPVIRSMAIAKARGEE